MSKTWPIAFTTFSLACAPALLGTETKTVDDGDSVSDSDTETDTAEPWSEDTDNPTDPDTGDTSDDDTSSSSPEAIDYRQVGPYTTTTSTTTLTASCPTVTQITTPTSEGPWPRVMLAHGFMRGTAQMIGWAEHLASWGMEVVTPGLCHATIVDSDHTANGSDLVQWNAQLGGGPVIYAGQSAGGLAALIAASNDPETVGLIGLDLTDADSLGFDAASGVTADAYGLAGMPSTCNSEGNGISAMRSVSGANVVRITDADHCDFENETDWLCTSFCENATASFSDADIQRSVLGLMTSAAASASGIDPDADLTWWQSGGVFFDELRAAGALTPL